MNLVDHHFTLIVGVDMHFTTSPPFNPLHPFIGMVFDPMDYIPFIGSTVNVNGLPRGVSDTSGILFTGKHIPLVGAFAAAPMIAHESVNFFGGLNTYVQRRRLSPTTFQKMTCNDIGIPLSLHAGEKFKPIPSLFAPTSFSIPIPVGNPVMLGGPFVPDLAGAAINLVASYGFSALLKGAGKLLNRFKKAEAEIAEDLGSTMEKEAEKTTKCGDPVNVVTGTVVYSGCDFELAGPLPLKWERNWYSDSHYKGLLGHGCTSIFDTKIKCMPDYLAVLLPDGRGIGFPLLDINEEHYDRAAKMTLSRKDDHYTLYHHKTRLLYAYDAFNGDEYRLTTIHNEQGFSIGLSYENAQLSRIRDSTGRLLKIATDDERRITEVWVTEQNGKTHLLAKYTYNETGDLCQITDALHKSTHIVYERHLMVKKTDRNGQSFYWRYDGLSTGSRCIHSWGDHGLLEVRLQYGEGFNKVMDGIERATTYYFDNRHLITQVTDVEGHHRFTEYTEFEERYREIDEEGNLTGYSYDDRGHCTAVLHPDGARESFTYDEQDRLTMYNDAMGNSTMRVYNDDGLLESIIQANNSITTFDYNKHNLLSIIADNAGKRTTLKYDDTFNLLEMQQPDGNISRWDYDGLGKCIRHTNAAGGVQSFIYDPLGRATRIHQPDGNILWFEYNAYEEVVKARDSQHEVSFEYTPLGSLRERKESNASLQFQYNPEEELTHIVNEHQETYSFQRNSRGEIIVETGFDGSARLYQRQRNGWVSKVQRPGDKFTQYEYDQAGRVVRTEYSDGTWEVFNYDRNGQLISAINEHASVYLQRDVMGRVTGERSVVGGQEYSVNSAYNRLHQRTTVTSSLGANIQLAYTDLGQVENICAQHHNTATPWTAALRYNALGLETERWLPGGIVNYFEYDHAGRPLRQKLRNGNRELRRRQYTWNANDRLVSMLNELTSGLVNYNHDDFGNLVSAEYEDGRKQYKSPDVAGNIYRTPQQNDRRYNAGGQLAWADGTSYTYDPEGNLLSTSFPGGKQLYEWSGNGMLRSVILPDGVRVSFEYDALGRRVAKICGDKITRWVWDGNVPLHEWVYALAARPAPVLDDMGIIQPACAEPVPDLVTWVFNEGSFVPAAKLSDASSYSIISDYLGTPVEMYDSAGQKVWDCELDIYGKARILAKGELGDCPFRYQGQYEDLETGLYYNRFRYYDPERGGYLSKDPIGLQGGIKAYGYVSDVASLIDPQGLRCKVAKDAKWQKSEQGIDGPGIRDHFAKHGEQVGAKNLKDFDESARKPIKNGREFNYKDRYTGERRIGYHDTETGLFTATSQKAKTPIIHTHFPESWENLRKLPGFSVNR